MPKGPRGEKRPADANACAVMVARIATGEIEDNRSPMGGKTRSGKAGGMARAAALTEDKRREIAGRAAEARWNKERGTAMTATACDKLAALYKSKASSGLIDTKFFVSKNIGDAPPEVVCAEALRFDEAVERGDTAPLDFNDRHNY